MNDMTKPTKNELAVPAIAGDVTNFEERQKRTGQGSENVTASDCAIPRIKVLQDLSPEVKKSNAKYVEGAEAGMFINSVTNEIFNAFFVVNLHFRKSTVVWKKRAAGGGMFGAFDNEALARAALAEANEREEQFDIVETPEHLVMILDETGVPKGVALMDMPLSKTGVSKRWNSLIQDKEKEGHPRFGCVWELSVTHETTNKGDFFGMSVEFICAAPDDIYLAAETAFDAFFGREKDAA